MTTRRAVLEYGLLTSGAVLFAGRGVGQGSAVRVTDHGADPSGRKDSTSALRAAIAALPKENGQLVLASGTYRVDASSGPVLNFQSLSGLTVEGNHSTLLFKDLAQPLILTDCSGTTLRNFSVDWQTPPFVEGRVQACDGNVMSVALEPAYASQVVDKVETIGEYDPANRLPKPGGIDSYYNVASVEPAARGLLKLTLKRPLPFKTGMYLVMRRTAYGSNAITLRTCTGTHLSGVSIHASPGMGLLGLGSTDITLEDVSVVPAEGTTRFLSTNSDAMHFTDCHGQVSVNRCKFRGMGDDGINLFASYWKVETSGAGVVSLSGRGKSPIGSWQLPRPGDTVTFVDAETLSPVTEATVAQAKQEGPQAALTFRETQISVPPGSLACNAGAVASLHVSFGQFTGNRARGIVAHRNVSIANSLFSGCSMAAILLAPDARWMEGPAVENVTIRDNQFSNCAYGPASPQLGVITVATNHDLKNEEEVKPQINRQIMITGNSFASSRAAAIFCNRAKTVTVDENKISGSGAQILFRNSSSLRFAANTGLGVSGLSLNGCTAVEKGV
jgi:hypothetical protein